MHARGQRAHRRCYLDGIVLKRTWVGEVRNVSLLVATGVNARMLTRRSLLVWLML